VRRDAAGRWVLTWGERVLVTVRVAVPTRRYHVAVVDKLPACLEPEALVARGARLGRPGARCVDALGWSEHANLRDERAEAFASLLWEGLYELRYTARVTAAGQFMAPPAKAEEMYQPEVNGSSSGDVFHVLAGL
jgi:uncharacterized protein YfaS (alpha-2-macroglobulin family)